MSEIMEFGLDESKVIKSQTIERFKLNRHGEIGRVSIVSFKKFSDMKIAQKQAEKGAPLTDDEKTELIGKIDAKLKEQLKKEELSEVDRMDIKSPRFFFAYTHYDERVSGTVRCLSKYNGTTLAKPEICCNTFGEAEQTVACVVLVYPVDKEGVIDLEYLAKKKNVSFQILKMSAKKFKKIESTLLDARRANMPVIDIKLTLDGDSKYQKFVVESGMTAAWAADESSTPELRAWVIDQGIRAAKFVKNELGYEMSKDKMIEKIRGGGASGSQSLGSGEAAAEKPQLQTSYGNLLED